MPPQLSLDIQVEIIKSLPVKSLIQFRSVCKSWKSFIDSSQFIAGYNVSRDQPQHLMISYEVGDGEEREVKYVCFIDDDTFPQQKFDLTIPPLVQATIVIGSSHGLLCLTGYLREPDGSRPTSVVVLWNPAIRKSIAIVVPNEVHPPFNSVIGFGVCPDTKDPKLVQITYIYDIRKMESILCIPCQVMVFTLSSDEWTPSRSNQLPRKSIQLSGFQVVIGRLIYWVAYERIAMDGVTHNVIMSFDLSTHEFREVDLPDSLRKPCLCISRLKESLVLFEYNINTIKQVCNVWMMDHGDQKTFTKQFTIKAPDASVSSTLGFRKSGEPIIEMQYDDLQCALVVYEPCLELIKDLGIRGNKYSFFGSSYTESLLLLDHEDGHITECGADTNLDQGRHLGPPMSKPNVWKVYARRPKAHKEK